MPKLISLDLSSNQINDFRDLKDLPRLDVLNLSGNQIEKIRTPLPLLNGLTTLNLEKNLIQRKATERKAE